MSVIPRRRPFLPNHGVEENHRPKQLEFAPGGQNKAGTGMTHLKTSWTWKTYLVILLVVVFVPFGFLLVLKWLFGENLNIGKKLSA